MEWAGWDVRDLHGKSARIEIVDQHSGDWGHIDIDQIELADTSKTPGVPLVRRHDHGTMTLALFEPTVGDRGIASIPAGTTAEAVFGGELPAKKPFGTKLKGAIVRTMKLEPGQEASARFAMTWHFPNLSLPGTRLARRPGQVLCHPVCIGRSSRPIPRPEPGPADAGDPALAPDLVRFDAAPLVSGPDVRQYVDPGHLDLPPVQEWTVLRLGRRWLLRRDLHSRLALCACRGTAVPGAGTHFEGAG